MAEKGYRQGSHTVYDIKFHLVWVTKYRYKVLTGEVALRAREVIRRMEAERGETVSFPEEPQKFPHPTSDPKHPHPGGHGPHTHYNPDTRP